MPDDDDLSEIIHTVKQHIANVNRRSDKLREMDAQLVKLRALQVSLGKRLEAIREITIGRLDDIKTRFDVKCRELEDAKPVQKHAERKVKCVQWEVDSTQVIANQLETKLDKLRCETFKEPELDVQRSDSPQKIKKKVTFDKMVGGDELDDAEDDGDDDSQVVVRKSGKWCHRVLTATEDFELVDFPEASSYHRTKMAKFIDKIEQARPVVVCRTIRQLVNAIDFVEIKKDITYRSVYLV